MTVLLPKTFKGKDSHDNFFVFFHRETIEGIVSGNIKNKFVVD